MHTVARLHIAADIAAGHVIARGHVAANVGAGHAVTGSDAAGDRRIGADDGKIAVNILRRAGKVQLDGFADLVIFVVAEQAPLFRLEQPVPLEEHGVDGIVILPRQLCRDGQNLAVRFRFLGGLFFAFAAKELVEAELQRVGQQRQKLQVRAADIALPL